MLFALLTRYSFFEDTSEVKSTSAFPSTVTFPEVNTPSPIILTAILFFDEDENLAKSISRVTSVADVSFDSIGVVATPKAPALDTDN